LKIMNNRSEEQEDLVKLYKRQSYFIDNTSTMNRICHYIERHLKEDQKYRREQKVDFDHTVLYTKEFEEPSKTDVEKTIILYKEWKSLRRSIMDNRSCPSNMRAGIVEETYVNMDQVNSRMNARAYSTISSSSIVLGDMSVYLCYAVLGQNSRNFAWSVFGREISENIREKRTEKFVRVPLPTETGNMKYLFNSYSMHLINIEEL
jgi:hypothetical protein